MTCTLFGGATPLIGALFGLLLLTGTTIREVPDTLRFMFGTRMFDGAEAETEPFDADAQRLAIEVCLRRGRHSEAHRRYSVYRKKLAASFGSEPSWNLRDVESGLAATIPGGRVD